MTKFSIDNKNDNFRTVYLISLACIFALSVYPLYMGVSILNAYLSQGGVNISEYPKYIIPYTPICIALVVVTIFLPLLRKITKKYILPLATAISAILFFIFEHIFEQVTVFDYTYFTPEVSAKTEGVNIEYWQMALCRAYTPAEEELLKNGFPPFAEYSAGGAETVKNSFPLLAEYSPAFKIHFYIISIVIILAIISIIIEFYKIYVDGGIERKRPVFVQLVVTIIFLGLCVLACFTAFFRSGSISVSPVSAILMTLFFLTFGLNVGVYIGCIFYQRNKFISLFLPSVAASATTLVMYLGELILLDGKLYSFGRSFLFKAIGSSPFSSFDIVTIVAAGAITYIVIRKILYPKKKTAVVSLH